MNRAPYADCIRCGERKSNLESYLPSGEYRTLWIYGNNVEVMLLDLNMKSILEKYYNGGNLEILEEMNIVLQKNKRSLERVMTILAYLLGIENARNEND